MSAISLSFHQGFRSLVTSSTKCATVSPLNLTFSRPTLAASLWPECHGNRSSLRQGYL